MYVNTTHIHVYIREPTNLVGVIVRYILCLCIVILSDLRFQNIIIIICLATRLNLTQ